MEKYTRRLIYISLEHIVVQALAQTFRTYPIGTRRQERQLERACFLPPGIKSLSAILVVLRCVSLPVTQRIRLLSATYRTLIQTCTEIVRVIYLGYRYGKCKKPFVSMLRTAGFFLSFTARTGKCVQTISGETVCTLKQQKE